MAKKRPTRTHLPLPLPEPAVSRTFPHQNGITDPMWPEKYPESVDPSAVRRLLAERAREKRLDANVVMKKAPDARRASGAVRLRVRRPRRPAGLSVHPACRRGVSTADELKSVLRLVTEFALAEMGKQPSREHIRLLEPIPESYRVTVTVGFGASLFVDRTGFDRFGFRARSRGS